MRTFSILRLMAFTMGIAVALPSGKALAQASANCGGIAADLSAAIEKAPARTLMLVEDALVINESCAGEIIKAAIVASHADAEMANQIVQTGVNVAPKMAAVITDAGASVAPGAIVASNSAAAAIDEPIVEEPAADEPPPVVSATGPASSGKHYVDSVAATNDDEETFAPVSSSLRGIYLVQQPPSGQPPFDVCRKCGNIPTSPCNCTP